MFDSDGALIGIHALNAHPVDYSDLPVLASS
jgi:hypothetical protein